MKGIYITNFCQYSSWSEASFTVQFILFQQQVLTEMVLFSGLLWSDQSGPADRRKAGLSGFV